MARRAVVEKVMTPVQGDDAWVEVTKPTVGEVEDILAAGDDVYESFSVGKQILVDHVKNWNWADEEGKPLPSPMQEPGIINTITLDEYQEIVQILLGAQEEEEKN